jgi:hypothetical protein
MHACMQTSEGVQGVDNVPACVCFCLYLATLFFVLVFVSGSVLCMSVHVCLNQLVS